MRLSTCHARDRGLLFPPRRRGNPTTATDTAGNRRTGRTGGPACRFESRLEVSGNWGGRFGRSPDGDPSGSSSGEDQGRLRGLPRQARKSRSRSIERSTGDQVARPVPTVILRNHHSSGTCPTATPNRSWVPGPTPVGLRTPRGLRLRLSTPSGFLASRPSVGPPGASAHPTTGRLPPHGLSNTSAQRW
jgi:hypothetical protein